LTDLYKQILHAPSPEPWNENDAYTWTDAILKYGCIEAPSKNTLHASEFALSETAQQVRQTYLNEEEKERHTRRKMEEIQHQGD
jgi:hypothetical protein